jgi:DNA polymerase V
VKLSYPTDFTPDLVESPAQLLDTLYRPGVHYQKCGVMLLDLSPVAHVQADLFDMRDRAREVWLMRALDALNADYGMRTVRVGNIGGSRPAWAMRHAFRSPRYTTNWRELPVVR